MKIISWNVNGIRAALKKGFMDWLAKARPDILCLQETKAEPDQVPDTARNPKGYTSAWESSRAKKGYSGVATYSKTAPRKASPGLGTERFDREGRVLATDHGAFWVYNIYFPNGQMNEVRLRYKMDFYEEVLRHCVKKVKQGHKLVVCGDYNTAHHEIDIARPKENQETSGFLPEERAWEEAGFVDSFRTMHPTKAHAYSWWSFRSNARARNVGWRIDYHYISPNLKPALKRAGIHADVMGSDHCPISLELDDKKL